MPEDLFEIAQQSTIYARNFIQDSSNDWIVKNSAEVDMVKVVSVDNSIENMRLRGRTAHNQINIKTQDFLRLDYDNVLFQIEHALEGIQGQKKGNCGEYSLVGLKFLATHYPHIYAQIYSIEGGDHACLVLGETSIPNNSADWEAEVLNDIWAEDIFLAKDYSQNLKNLKHHEDGTLEIEDFNPEKHCLVAEENYSSQFINSFNKPEHLKDLNTYFLVKLHIMQTILQFLFVNCKSLYSDNVEKFPNEAAAIGSFVKLICNIHVQIHEMTKTMPEFNPDTTYSQHKSVLTEQLKTIIEKFSSIITVEKVFDHMKKNKPKHSDFYSKVHTVTHLRATFEEVIKTAEFIFNFFIEYGKDHGIMYSIKEPRADSVIDVESIIHQETTDQIRIALYHKRFSEEDNTKACQTRPNSPT
jgi:hypothetical protein